MDIKERAVKVAQYHQEQMDILNKKGADYTGGEAAVDANANFKEVARRLKGSPMSPLTVWAVYFEKQVLAVETFVKTGRVESEGLDGRFNDIANYAQIGRTLVEEQLKAQKLLKEE